MLLSHVIIKILRRFLKLKKVLGIIAEYNPFHNGHLYHLENSKKATNCDYSVAIISGNFTQRGSTSIVDKWEKTKMALSNGIDLVLELPTLYSISSAENFADGSIKILNSLGIIDFLSFGSETSDINLLNNIADILYNEPNTYKKALIEELKKGFSFPKARENALLNYLNNKNYSNILSSPNNILGIEYLKSLKKHKSKIQPIYISRHKAHYNSTDIYNNIASATAIRKLLKNKDFNKIKNLLPNSTYSILMENINNKHIIGDLDIFEKEILYTLRKMSIEEIAKLPDVSEGLEFTIKNAANSCNNIYDLLNTIKSKRYTQSRIQRVLLYSLLGITKNDIKISKDIIPYVRILGFNNYGRKLISEIYRKNPDINIITSVKRFVDTNTNKDLELLLKKDIFSTNIYTLGFEGSSLSNLDFTNNIVKI
ncbi:MAG: nucleotidyltransferase [Clostridia bacterium]|nr:nucleotidyltransferase [Clostridia bacterium]